MKKNNLLAYLFIEFLRIIIPVFIFIFPLFTVIFVTFLDAIDGDFASRKILTKEKYQKIDKTLDMWWYLWVLSYSYFNFKSFFIILLVLLIYRIVGYLIFFFSNNRKLLMFFPNLYENIFFLIFFATYFKLNFLISGNLLFISIFVVSILKLIQEYWLHILNKSVREDIFKLPKRNWLKD